jgi:hypothetical protein
MMMKFSEIDQATWQANKTYFDTCVIPISGLDGSESPDEAVAKLAALQLVIDQLEANFRGRIIVYPALHYVNETTLATIQTHIEKLKETNFKHVVLLSKHLISVNVANTAVDIVLNEQNLQKIVTIWQ